MDSPISASVITWPGSNVVMQPDAETTLVSIVGSAVRGRRRQYQTRAILDSFATMLASVGSGLDHVIHVNVFLADMADFAAMNEAYAERMGRHRPARTVIGVHELPKPGFRLTMNLAGDTAD